MRIGPIQLATPFCQAGLAGYSDRAMRTVARRRGCPYAVTEALLDTIMLAGGIGLKRSIDISDEDHPVAGQIIGSEAENMAKAARILAQAGYDVIDLNFACPVKKIKNKARGGHMLRDVDRAVAILKTVRDALPPHVPTTVSLRRGFDESTESVDLFHEIVQAAWANGYAAVRVHGRTVEQKYLGRSRWEFLRQVKAQYPDKTILGSGDVFTAEDAVAMLRETGVDVVWIARGAIGNPWIFQQAAELLRGADYRREPSGYAAGLGEMNQPSDGPRQSRWAPECKHGVSSNSETTLPLPPGEGASSLPLPSGEGRGEGVFENQTRLDPPHALTLTLSRRERGQAISPPTIHQQREALSEHFSIAMQIHGEQLAGRRMRKMGIKYARFHPQAAQVKTEFINVRSLRDWNSVLGKWYAADGEGIWPDPKAADEVNDSPNDCKSGAAE